MKLMIGTAQFDRNYGIANKTGKISREEIKEILEFALENKIEYLDTGNDYGNSESIIGEISQELNTNFKVFTKLHFDFENNSIDVAKNEIIKSANKLNKIYGLLVHNSKYLLTSKSDDIMNMLLDFKNSGIIEKIGVSAGTTDQIKNIINKYHIDVVQLPTNILDQRFLQSGLIDLMHEKNIEIHIRSVFLQGLLLMKKEDMPKYFQELNLDLLYNAIKEKNISMIKLSLEYAKSLNVDRIIVGIDNKDHLAGIINEYNEPFNNDINFKDFCVSDERFTNPANWNVGGWK